jgi:hypothetical protein
MVGLESYIGDTRLATSLIKRPSYSHLAVVPGQPIQALKLAAMATAWAAR